MYIIGIYLTAGNKGVFSLDLIINYNITSKYIILYYITLNIYVIYFIKYISLPIQTQTMMRAANTTDNTTPSTTELVVEYKCAIFS